MVEGWKEILGLYHWLTEWAVRLDAMGDLFYSKHANRLYMAYLDHFEQWVSQPINSMDEALTIIELIGRMNQEANRIHEGVILDKIKSVTAKWMRTASAIQIRDVESGFALFKRLQQLIDAGVARKEYSLSLLYLQLKIEKSEQFHDILKNSDFNSLIPTMVDQIGQDKRYWIKLYHLIWSDRYNQAIKVFEAAKSRKDVDEMERIVVQMLEGLSPFLEGPYHDVLDQEQRAYYERLRADYEQIREFICYTKKYNGLERRYNEAVDLIKSEEYIAASALLKSLAPELSSLSVELSGGSTNPRLNGLHSAIAYLEERVVSSSRQVEEAVVAVLRGSRVSLAGLEEVSDYQMDLPMLTQVDVVGVRMPLYAKVVLLGESSVGKTHLVLTMTGRAYSSTQGSTVGVDKFFKLVKTGLEKYDTYLCFWDLGGQWNFRTLNELFLFDASVVILVFDISRKETFDHLRFWGDLIRRTRGPLDERVVLVANKIDVGGPAISEEMITEFMRREGFRRLYRVSAKTGEGIKELFEDLTGTVDWMGLIAGVTDAEILKRMETLLERLSQESKVMGLDEVLSRLSQGMPEDIGLLKALLRRIQSQKVIQMGRADKYVILDVEFVDKRIAAMIEEAARKGGHLSKTKGLELWNPGKVSEFELLMSYLEADGVCYRGSMEEWVFPNVIHAGKEALDLDDYDRAVLQSGRQSFSLEFSGVGELAFTRLTVFLSHEIGPPKYVSNVGAFWRVGSGKNQSAVLIQLISREGRNMIRVTSGGSEGASVKSKVEEILDGILRIYT